MLVRNSHILLGGLVGFTLFFALLHLGFQVSTDKLSDALNIVGIGVATLGGAWAGGVAAFNAEAQRRDKKEREMRISAANKAIFKIALIQDALENMWDYSVEKDGARQAPDRAIRMDSPQSGMIEAIRFDFDELTFLLDKTGDTSAQLLMEVAHLEWHFQVLRQTINLRAQAREELEKARQLNPVLSPGSAVQAMQIVYRAQYTKLDGLTTEFVDLIEDGLKMTKSANKNMQAVLQSIFPNQDFLQIQSATVEEKEKEKARLGLK